MCLAYGIQHFLVQPITATSDIFYADDQPISASLFSMSFAILFHYL
jgi:hypothetical protein